MIFGEVGSLSSPPSLATCLITTQLEGLTLSRASYNNISSLISSMFYLPTGTMEYVGHIINLLTLYWRYSTIDNILDSIGIYSELAQEGVRMINAEGREFVIHQINVSKYIIILVRLN